MSVGVGVNDGTRTRHYLQVRRAGTEKWRFEGEYDLDVCRLMAKDWQEEEVTPKWETRILVETIIQHTEVVEP